ncbi:CopD family protein [Mycolicibacterium cosmeticum]|uniref:copper resistance D family protein n=1 Tax=Mycolicibacterium cosmeticum TaxID=258533 RepID=UPI0032049200
MAGTPPAPEFGEVVSQMLYDLGLSAAVGLGMAVAVLTTSKPNGVLRGRLRRLAIPTAGFVALSAAAHIAVAADLDTLVRLQAGTYLATVAAMLCIRMRDNRTVGWTITVLALLTAMVPELTLRSVTASSVAAKALTLAHIAGTLVWIGGLTVLAVVGLMGLHREADAECADEWHTVWERFSVAAACAVGALIVSGAWLTWSHVGTPMQLLTTSYGRHLALKMIIVMLLICAGAYNTRVLLPRIRSARRNGDTASAIRLAVRHFPQVVTGESLLIIAVLAIVPFLRGSARTEASAPAAGPFDFGSLGAGIVLVLLVTGALWIGTRTPTAERTV